MEEEVESPQIANEDVADEFEVTPPDVGLDVDVGDDAEPCDFVMQQAAPDTVSENLFGDTGGDNVVEEEVKENEESGLQPIPEETAHGSTIFSITLENGTEEMIDVQDDLEAKKAMEEYMDEEKAVAERIQREAKEKERGFLKDTSEEVSIGIREVNVDERYDAVSRDISGDFRGNRARELFIHHSLEPSYASSSNLGSGLMEESESVKSEEEEEIEEVTEEEYVDREPYYELYKSLMKDYPMLKMKNNFLQRKMAEYFKRRKMEHVLRESERAADAQVKYYKKLDALWDLKNTNNMQRSAITTELNDMREMRDRQVKAVVENFEAMQAREREIGKGLIFTKTAKEIPEKFLDRLLKNQRTKSKEIMEMRLCFIKLRNNIEEITAAIKAMDKIGENHTLIDYEQLKMENQNHADKIEERDEELHKLRTKCAAAIQTLAHLREKSSSTDIDILEMTDRLDDVEMERSDWRERVNQLKKERDTLRANFVKLQEESGLLTKPKLLLDMEDTFEQIEACKAEMQQINATYNQKAVALEAIKKNIQEEKDYYHPEKYLADRNRKPKVWKGKPKLKYPVLEKFNIKNFQKY